MSLPRIVVDTREQRPLRFGPLPVVRATLKFGDYALRGMETRVCVERKSVADLWGSLTQPGNWGRLNAEFARAQAAGCRLHVVVEGTPSQVLRPSRYAAMQPARVLDRLWESCHRFGASATFADNKGTAAAVVLAILRGAFRAEHGE